MVSYLLLLLIAAAVSATDATPSIADTNYAVPANAWFVAPNGDASQPGTTDAPLRTIAVAIDRAPSGTTLVIRKGVYRESVGSLNKVITLQAYPREQVWLKGSVELDGWVATPRGYR